jgi:D-tyrosyl-tRNA(Tyr) deacylase
MRVVLQRVTRAAVSWESERNEIGLGLLILVGVGPSDDEVIAGRLAAKVAQLRVFEDEAGKTNRSLLEVGGEALVVSQFTLYADTTRGRRPSFIGAAEPDCARQLCDRFAARLTERGLTTRTGSFGARMLVSLENDGPVTLVLSTEPWETRISG